MSLRQVDVKCPFYRKDDGLSRIYCDGAIKGSVLRSWFPTKEAFVAQFETQCCNKYVKCPIYVMLWDTWEEEEDAVDH